MKPCSRFRVSGPSALLLCAFGLITSLAVAATCASFDHGYPGSYEAAQAVNGDWYIHGWTLGFGRYERVVDSAQYLAMEDSGNAARLGTGGWGHSDVYPVRQCRLGPE